MMQNTEHTAAPLLVRGGRVHERSLSTICEQIEM